MVQPNMSTQAPPDSTTSSHPQTDYESLAKQATALLEDEPDFIANSANFASLVYHGVGELNWAGFYFKRGKDLVLGPFCGKPACARIAIGKGVCGTAAARRQTIAVDDVNEFEGHIACDAASRAEIVVPLMRRGELIGVFDLDSARLARFTPEDQRGIELLVQRFIQMSDPAGRQHHEQV